MLRLSRIFRYRESGVTLLEMLIALAILGTVAVSFLSGVASSSRVAFVADEEATAFPG
ncbi:MAG: type II secretion system protein [Chloroflexota bacterium]